MAVFIPKKVITDVGRFEAGEFGDPKWIIMRNNAGLQLQMFWPNKSEDDRLHENNNGEPTASPNWIFERHGRTPLFAERKRRRKRSPQKVVSEENPRLISGIFFIVEIRNVVGACNYVNFRNSSHIDDRPQNDEATSSTR